jgi:hypothetical protein
VARGVAWAIVIGGHVLLLVLISNSRPRDRETPESTPKERTVLLFLDLAPPPDEQQPAPDLQPFHTTVTRALSEPTVDSSSTAITESAPSEIPPGRANVDWYREAQQVAQNHAAELAEHNKPQCDPSSSDRPGSLLPKCKRRVRPHEWEPEEPKAGFDHLIPYVRLGKRCVVGLGFLGCAFGKLPEADGHLFDDMHDPDRPTSSVPDIPGKDD